MDATPHLALGAALGMRVRNALAAFLLGVASHAVLDALPHFNYTGWRPFSPALAADVASATCAALLVAWLAPRPLGALGGAAGAAFPEVARLVTGQAKDFLQAAPFGLQQKEIPPPGGLLTQAAVVALSLLLGWRWRRRL